MRDIWASSPNDVYVVGHNERGFGKMFHFDGKNWKPVGLNPLEGGTIAGSIDLTAIYGFHPNDIWAVGVRNYTDYGPPQRYLDSSLVIHFDGRQWSEYKVNGDKILQSIWGNSSADVWAAGWNMLYHFNGGTWKQFSISLPSQGIQFISINGNSSNDVYMNGFRNDVVQPVDTSALFLYHYNGNLWSVIDSVVRTTGPPEDEKFGHGLFAVNNTLFSAGYGVFKNTSGRWERMFYADWPILRIYGTSTSNLFAVGEESQVYHFNGVDWYRYSQFSGTEKYFSSVWTNGVEVFVVGNNGLKTYILHGK
ncbi:MAG: hypothetical protein HY276_01995 [Ignavibacteriales bacterium]|nr:hypothetical protein [Ignavibacteriales bacterium]MBI3787003.1 hypothetical protein [Ignavibacteriales bacterium]